MQRPAERCGALMFAVVAEGAKKEGTAGEEAGAPVLLNHGQDPCSGIRRRCHYQIVPNRAIFVPRKAGRGGFLRGIIGTQDGGAKLKDPALLIFPWM